MISPLQAENITPPFHFALKGNESFSNFMQEARTFSTHIHHISIDTHQEIRLSCEKTATKKASCTNPHYYCNVKT